MTIRTLHRFTLFTIALVAVAAVAVAPLARAQDHAGHNHGAGVSHEGTQPAGITMGADAKMQGQAIVFDTPSYSFGKVKAGADIIHDFWFTNPGTELVKITAVRPSCGCTTTGSWDKEVPPGGSGRIPIKVSTRGFSGKIAKVVTVNTSVPSAMTVQLKVEGEVWQPLQVTPASLSFGRLKEDEMDKPKQGEVQFHNNTKVPVTISSISTANDRFKAELVEGPSVQPGRVAKIKVTMTPPYTPGSMAAQVQIKTDSPDAPEMTFITTAFIPQPVSVLPTRIQIPADLTGPRQFMARIECARKEQVKVLGVKCSDDRIRTTLEGPNTDKSYNLQIEVPAKWAASASITTVTVDTDEPTAKTLTIYLAQAVTRTPTVGTLPPGQPPQGNPNGPRMGMQPANPATPQPGAAKPAQPAGNVKAK